MLLCHAQPGNSGGPLLDSAGELIGEGMPMSLVPDDGCHTTDLMSLTCDVTGTCPAQHVTCGLTIIKLPAAGINTAIYSPSGANAGVGFAVPIDILRSSVSQIIEHGKVTRPILGIAFAPEQSVEQARSTRNGIVCVCVVLANFGKFRVHTYPKIAKIRIRVYTTGSPAGGHRAGAFHQPGVSMLQQEVHLKYLNPTLHRNKASDQPAFCSPFLQLGVQGILVLDTRKGGPAYKAGILGTSRDDNVSKSIFTLRLSALCALFYQFVS